jgi:hypothetical protein
MLARATSRKIVSRRRHFELNKIRQWRRREIRLLGN